MFDIVKSVGKHFFVYGFGHLLNRFMALLFIPLYTHYLPPEDYGTLELLDLTTFIVGLVLAAGISASLVRFFYDSEDLESRKQVVGTAFLFMSLVAVVGAAVLIADAPSISKLVFSDTGNTGLFRIVFVTMTLGLISEVPMALLQAQQRSKLFSAVSVTRFALSLGLNIWFIVGLGWGLKGILYSALINQAAGAVFLIAYTLRYSGFRFAPAHLWPMIRFGFPIVFQGGSNWIVNYTDRFFVEKLISTAQVGIYGLGYKFGFAMNALVNSPYESIIRPKLFELKDHPDARRINATMMTYFMFMATFIGLGISILIQDVLTILAPPEYFSAWKVVPVIIIAYILNGAYIHIQTALQIVKRTKHIAYIAPSAAITNLVLNYYLIPDYGIMGAAVATVASFFVMTLINLIVADQIYRVPYEYFRLGKLLVAAVGLFYISLLFRIDNLVLSMLANSGIALSYPLVLFLLAFYRPNERAKIRELAGQGFDSLRRKLGGSPSPPDKPGKQ